MEYFEFFLGKEFTSVKNGLYSDEHRHLHSGAIYAPCALEPHTKNNRAYGKSSIETDC